MTRKLNKLVSTKHFKGGRLSVAQIRKALNLVKKENWKKQLNEVVWEDYGTGIFGHDIKLDAKVVRKYIKKVIKLGATKIEIVNYYTIQFVLPKKLSDRNELLLFVLINFLPIRIDYIKQKDILVCYWSSTGLIDAY